jgi:hypothetical protein
VVTKHPESLPSEPGSFSAVAGGWLPTDVDEVAGRAAATALPSTKPRPWSAALADGLAGKTVALVALGASDTAWMMRALELARAFPLVLNSGDSVAVPSRGQLFDVVAIDAALEWDAAACGMPVLFVGAPNAIARWTPIFRDGSHDFLITPCEPNEFLLRAYRLASCR